MSYLEKLKKLEEEQKKKKSEPRIVNISLLTLTEFGKRDLGIEVYSRVLGCEIWFCSNEKMAAKIRSEIPGAVTYTANELINLIKLNFTPEDIERIHAAKVLFSGSRVIEGKARET
jgi:hypothetical protein